MVEHVAWRIKVRKVTCYRIIAFLLIPLLWLGAGFSIDSPAALEGQLLQIMRVTKTEYEILYTVLYWPNVIVPILGGILLDRIIGHRNGTILFCGSVVLGQFLFVVGAIFHLFWLMCLGRFVFGLGAFTLAVSQFTYAGRWFQGRQIVVQFGLISTFTRLGSITDLNLSPIIFEYLVLRFPNSPNICIGSAFSIGFWVSIFSLLVAFILAFLDKKAEKLDAFNDNMNATDPKRMCPHIKDFRMPLSVWIMSAITMWNSIAIFSFISLAQVFFQTKYGLPTIVASFTNSAFYIMLTVSSLFCGILIDRVGLNVYWTIFSSLCILTSHVLLAFTYFYPITFSLLLGLGYAIMMTSLWPLPTYILSLNRLGTAYGIMTSIMSCGQTIFAEISGLILDYFGYFCLELMFALISLFGVVSSILLFYCDYMKEGRLNQWGPTRRKEAKANIQVDSTD